MIKCNQKITTPEENEQAIKLALTLEHRPNFTPGEETLLALLALLVTLIEKFEETHYPIPQGTSHSMLRNLIDARDMTPEALAEVIGSVEVVRKIVNGDRPINPAESKLLADYFHVDASLFT
jgi:HTH-type transcriptional regulator / antitoxin HigA